LFEEDIAGERLGDGQEQCCHDFPGGRPSGSYRRDKKNILNGLRRVEGQVRGIQRMVEEERYCVDVLTQVAAVRMALARLAVIIFENHTRGCVAEAIRNSDREKEIVDELMEIMKKFIQ